MIRGDAGSRQLCETPAEATRSAWFPFLSFSWGKIPYFASGDKFGLQVSEKAELNFCNALKSNQLRA
jgi:hypothetical protein